VALVITHETRWSAADAVNFVLAEAENRSQSWFHLCLNLCAQAYGYAGSGTTDIDHDGDPEAIEYWQSAAASRKHPGDLHPPVGALACWKSTTAGHIAVVVRSTGDDVQIASNDIVVDGDVDVVQLSKITEMWHQTYLGWVEPDFPNGAGTNQHGKRTPKNREAVSLEEDDVNPDDVVGFEQDAAGHKKPITLEVFVGRMNWLYQQFLEKGKVDSQLDRIEQKVGKID
jgi:surface antigen